ncbi:MAG TPA: hypothetical protein VK937_16405 [Candidatus Limnocylindria bacterium]|nr:hypothetical protein [Candidatus Limnocylindria bacterium]
MYNTASLPQDFVLKFRGLLVTVVSEPLVMLHQRVRDYNAAKKWNDKVRVVKLLNARGENMKGEWIDKEPRADGKPRRWKPSEIITVDPSRVIFQEARTEQHPLDSTQPDAHTNK